MSSSPTSLKAMSESQDGKSSRASSPPSSPPSEPFAGRNSLHVSSTMKQEEKRLKLQNRTEAKRRGRPQQKPAAKEDNGKAEKNKALWNYILQQSEVFTQSIRKSLQDKNRENMSQAERQKLEMLEAQEERKAVDAQRRATRRVANGAESADASIKPSDEGFQDLRTLQQPKAVTGGTMRKYQLEGLYWLTGLYENGANGILADEMGLGKTVQTIALLAFLREKGIFGPFLIVAPLSTVSNWIEEFARWTPSIPTVLYHGTPLQREEIRTQRLRNPQDRSFPVICTSYEICMNDKKYLGRYEWKYIIVDEGHRLKNLNCRLILELKKYQSANRLLITGTPLQNNLQELWSLLNFLMPDVFENIENFEDFFNFTDIISGDSKKSTSNSNEVLTTLHDVLKPFLLRRVKTDVEDSLPKKREYILYAPLTITQKELYREIKEGNSRAYLERKVVERLEDKNPRTRNSSLKRKTVSGTSTPNKSAKSSRSATPAGGIRSGRKGKKRQNYKEESDTEYFKNLEIASDSSSDSSLSDSAQEALSRAQTIALAKKEISRKKLQNPIMQLRLACNSPHNFYWPFAPDDSNLDETLVSSSGKMLLLDRLLPHLFSKNHKVLIFSQFKTQLDIIEAYATILRGWNVCRIDGQVKQEDRRQQIKSFNTKPEYKVFLLSTRAGGQGINLAAADTVILYDSDWNPQQDLQAQDRAHRIGQTRPVIVYRLASKGTVEQVLLEKAGGKRRLERAVIQKGKFRSLLGEDESRRGKTLDGEEEALKDVLLQGDDDDSLEKFDADEGIIGGRELLSQRDLDLLSDRSEEAYKRAEEGKDSGGRLFRCAETRRDGGDVL